MLIALRIGSLSAGRKTHPSGTVRIGAAIAKGQQERDVRLLPVAAIQLDMYEHNQDSNKKHDTGGCQLLIFVSSEVNIRLTRMRVAETTCAAAG